MKRKQINKRLVLNKSTIADLGAQRMGLVKGGETQIIPTVCASINPQHTCVNTCVSCTCVNCNTSAPYLCELSACDCSDSQGICKFTCGC